MTEQAYVAKLSEICTKRSLLDQEVRDLEAEFLKINRKFQDGERVKFKNHILTGIILRGQVNNHRIQYEVRWRDDWNLYHWESELESLNTFSVIFETEVKK